MTCVVSATSFEKVDWDKPRVGASRLLARQIIFGEGISRVKQCACNAEARRESAV